MASSEPITTFLGLPSTVRARIYTLAGLVRPCPISLYTERKRLEALKEPGPPADLHESTECFYVVHGSWKSFWPRNIDCFYSCLPIQLLRVCRSVHLETLPILYARNKFKVLGHLHSNLRILQALPPFAIASLTSLFIHLNCWPCPFGHDIYGGETLDCFFCGDVLKATDPPLTMTAGQDILSEWKTFCTYLGHAIRLGTLKLAIICDTKEMAVAQQVVEPTKYLPLLKEFAIRLSSSHERDLTALARRTIKARTSVQSPTSPFPFFNLPIEVRLQILNSTHLGAQKSCSLGAIASA